MTPYEFEVSVRGYYASKEREAEEYRIKYEQDYNLKMTQAYLTGYLCRAKFKSFPKLDEFLLKKKQKAMTDEQMLAKVKILNQMFGGEVIDG